MFDVEALKKSIDKEEQSLRKEAKTNPYLNSALLRLDILRKSLGKVEENITHFENRKREATGMWEASKPKTKRIKKRTK